MAAQAMRIAAALDRGLHRRLVDSLYVEAMVMADEARSYFDMSDTIEPEIEDPLLRVAFTCESLKVTTRLMHVIAWLLTQRAWQRGEIDDEQLADGRYALGRANSSDAAVIAAFPFAARALIDASEELYDRVARLQARMIAGLDQASLPLGSPARALIDRLQTAF